MNTLHNIWLALEIVRFNSILLVEQFYRIFNENYVFSPDSNCSLALFRGSRFWENGRRVAEWNLSNEASERFINVSFNW